MNLSLKMLKHLVLTVFVFTLSAFTVFAQTKIKAEPFKINVPQAKLDEIMQRIRGYKFHDSPTDAGWKYGIDQTYLKKLVAYWRKDYDWRKTEREINRFPQFIAKIDGQNVHFIYEKGSGKNPQPLVLLHGFPYSFYSFLDVIEPLAHPERFGGNAEDGFDVIVPSLPGFAFSDAPQELEGLHFAANRINRLMTDVLGYKKFIVQGGDFGDVVGIWLARDHPENIIGLHENQLAVRGADAPFNSGQIIGKSTAEEREFMKREQQIYGQQHAYFHLQVTRSETLSTALTDTPVGQAAWIIEKFYYWSDKTQKPFEQIYSMEHLLNEAMIYLVTDSFATSIRPYTAFAQLKEEDLTIPEGTKITVPVSLAAFPNDTIEPVPPRSLIERSRADIVQWTDFPRGGHFPMLEEPQLYIEDVRKFGRLLKAKK